jgi:hypothetical protein
MIELGPNANKSLLCVAEIQRKGKLKLTGLNKGGGGYQYAKIGDIFDVIDSFLAEHGMIDLVSVNAVQFDAVVEPLQMAKDATPKNKVITKTLCNGSYRVLNPEDKDDWVQVQCFGIKVDTNSDKGLGAHTIMRRYAMMSMYHMDVAGSDDPDDDNNNFARHFSSPAAAMDNLLQPSKPAAPPAAVVPASPISGDGAVGSTLSNLLGG